MRISEAFYTLASIRRTSTSHRPRPASPEVTADALRSPLKGAAAKTTNDRTVSGATVSTQSFAEMLHQHFAEEVRLRDRDRDGLLSQSEYASTPEEFQALDGDADGRIGVFDLVQAALKRNHDLSEIVAGPWAPIYSAIIDSPSTAPADLEAAAQMGASDVLSQDQDTADPLWKGSNSAGASQSATVESIMSEFRARHGRLDVLRARLDDLADRLRRTPQYRHVDHMA